MNAKALDMKALEMRPLDPTVPESTVTEREVPEIKVSEIKVSEIKVSEIKVSEKSSPYANQKGRLRQSDIVSGGPSSTSGDQHSSLSQWTSADHSALAMRAARQMRRVKHKGKHGRVICHHLRQMLLDDRPVEVQELKGVDRRFDVNRESAIGSAAERQISLGL